MKGVVNYHPGRDWRPGPGLEAWEEQLVRFVVADFWAPGQFPPHVDQEDLEQAAFEHWLRVRGKYDGTRGASPKTFLRRVVKNKLLDIVRGMQAGKREARRQTVSLQDQLGPDESLTYEEVIGSEEDTAREAQEAVLRGHIDSTSERLTSRQRAVVDGLSEGLTLAELSRTLRAPKSTLYGELERIRGVYRDAGLEEYLR